MLPGIEAALIGRKLIMNRGFDVPLCYILEEKKI